MQAIPAQLKPKELPDQATATTTYTVLWFYVPGQWLLKKFKIAGASYYKAKLKLNEVEPTAIEVAQSTITGETLYLVGTYCIEDITNEEK